MRFQQADTFHVLWTALGESLGDFMDRARMHLNDVGEPYELFLPDPQPCEAWITVLSAVWWRRKGLNLVLVSGGRGADEDYAVISRYGITFPQLLPPPRDGSERRIDLYNTGPAVTEAGDIPPGTMLYMQTGSSCSPILSATFHVQFNSFRPPCDAGYAGRQM